MGKKTVRLIIDGVLTIMVIFEMFIQYTGDFLHEVVGLAFFVTLVIHLLLSATWMKNTVRSASQGTLRGKRMTLAIMGCLLGIAMVTLGVSSVAISNVLYDAGFEWMLGSYAMWTTVHTVSSYALCALVVVHLAMHWAFIVAAFKVPYNPERRRAIDAGVHAVAALGALALCVAATKAVRPEQVSSYLEGDPSASPDGPDYQSDQPGTLFSTPLNDTRMRSTSRKNNTGTTSESSDESNDGDSSSEATESGNGDSNSEPAESGNEGSSVTATGNCPLCRKHCPLSAPQCDRPYLEGLL